MTEGLLLKTGMKIREATLADIDAGGVIVAGGGIVILDYPAAAA
jgi:hypothetical protein